jgi:hypothetical protein
MGYLINEKFWIFEKIHPLWRLFFVESIADVTIIEEDFSLFCTFVWMFECLNAWMNFGHVDSWIKYFSIIIYVSNSNIKLNFKIKIKN